MADATASEPRQGVRRVAGRVEERVEEATDEVAARARQIEEAYSGDEERPLGGYLVLICVYLLAVATAALLLRRRGTKLPASVSWSELLVGALATHRLSRLVTKDPIASPLRAPFTRYAGLSGPAELKEEVRGRGLGHALGELVTCPFCFAQWVATSLTVGRVLAPRATAIVASVFAAVGLADLLDLAYGRLEG